MNWIKVYNDLSTQEKRQVRQQLLNRTHISKTSFYKYLSGKKPQPLVEQVITTTISTFQRPKYTFVSQDCPNG